MYSFNWYYTESLFNILKKDLPWFSGAKYANLYSLCSCMIKLHSRVTVMKRKFTSPLDIVCRHLCLSRMPPDPHRKLAPLALEKYVGCRLLSQCGRLLQNLLTALNKVKNLGYNGWLIIKFNYINNLAKNQVSAVCHTCTRVICRAVSPKFIELCMETPCLCPSEGHNMAAVK